MTDSPAYKWVAALVGAAVVVLARGAFIRYQGARDAHARFDRVDSRE